VKVKGKGKKKEKKEDEEGEVFKWWENGEQGDGSIKWNTLEHSGVHFPPPYEPLPKDIKMMYNGMFEVSVLFFLTFTEVWTGKFVDLPPEAEEVAGFYAALLETEHAKDATFNNNFFEDWKTLLKKYPPVRCLLCLLNWALLIRILAKWYENHCFRKVRFPSNVRVFQSREGKKESYDYRGEEGR
jgi:hypothetical protein